MNQPSTSVAPRVKWRWWALAALSLSLLVLSINTTILNVALPTLAQDLHADTTGLQWITLSYNLVFAGALLPAGLAGDRWGRKLTLICGLLVFAVGSGVALLASTTGVVIVARALMGLGGAVVTPMTLSIIPTMFADDERGKAIGLWTAGTVLGIPLGPIVGGYLLNHFWWGSVFLVNLVMVLIALVAGAFLIPESKDSRTPSIDFMGVLVSAGGVVLLVYGLVHGQQGWGTAPTWANIIAGLLLLVGFVLWERRVASPLIDLALFRKPQFTWGTLAMAMMSFAIFGILFVIPQYLQGVLGYDAMGTGVHLLPIVIALTIASVGSDFAVSLLSRKSVITIGMLLLTAGFVLFAFVKADSGFGIAFGSLVMIGAGMGLAQPPAMDSVVGVLPPGNFGGGSALTNMIRQLGAAIGIAVLGSVLGTIYTGKLPARVNALPEVARSAVKGSVNGASAVATKLPAPLGAELRSVSQHAFVSGMGVTMWICAGVCVAGALLTLRFLPNAAKGASSPSDAEQSSGVPAVVQEQS